MRLVITPVLCFLLSYGGFAQDIPRTYTDPLELLKAVAATYAGAGAMFRIDSLTETVTTTGLSREWKKTYMSAAQGRGRLFRIETRAPYGSYLQNSDGVHEWVLLKEANAYVARAAPEHGPSFPKVFLNGIEVSEAWHMRGTLESLASSYQHASMLPKETIKLGGQKYHCYVVHVTSADLKRSPPPPFHSDETFWIDKSALVLRKQVKHEEIGLLVTQIIHVPMHEDVTTEYPVVDLHAEIPDSFFRFAPPTEAKQVATLEPDFPASNFADPGKQIRAELVGKPLPEAALPASARAAYKGKPLLLDYWATWCGPCREALPVLDRISQEFAKGGLQFATVDEDGQAEEARAYLERHHYAWTNYHDDDGALQKGIGSQAIPATVLVDAAGKVAYFNTGSDEEGLRRALAQLHLLTSKTDE